MIDGHGRCTLHAYEADVPLFAMTRKMSRFLVPNRWVGNHGERSAEFCCDDDVTRDRLLLRLLMPRQFAALRNCAVCDDTALKCIHTFVGMLLMTTEGARKIETR